MPEGSPSTTGRSPSPAPAPSTASSTSPTPWTWTPPSVASSGSWATSVDAYPMLLVEEAFVQRPELVFTACSGAVSHDIDRGIIGGYEAQIDPEPRPEVGLVTITVGGNDVIFSRVVQLCLLYEDCLNEQFEPPEEDRSRPTVEFPPSAPFEPWARAALLGAGKQPRSRVQVALSHLPEPRVIVVGYPYLFPAGSQWRWPPDCAVVLSRVDSQERTGLRQLTDRLNNLLYEHATASGLEFLSPARGVARARAVWQQRSIDGCRQAGDRPPQPGRRGHLSSEPGGPAAVGPAGRLLSAHLPEPRRRTIVRSPPASWIARTGDCSGPSQLLGDAGREGDRVDRSAWGTSSPSWPLTSQSPERCCRRPRSRRQADLVVGPRASTSWSAVLHVCSGLARARSSGHQPSHALVRAKEITS